jgi:hypothetical protein
MTQMKSDPNAKPGATEATPIFVPKQEGAVELTLDEALVRIAALYVKFAPLKKELENIKTVAKQLLKAKGEKSYTTIQGIKAQFITSNKSQMNKELAKELCGARWAEVEKFVESISFKVTVPGVKSPDAE